MSENTLSQKLVQLGFSKNEAAVYQSLIKLGQCKASVIIKDTGLHRNIVYEALDELVERKLAFKTSKGGVAFFQLSDANTLVQEAESALSMAQSIAQEINRTRHTADHEVKLYEGVEGLKSLRARTLSDLKKETDPKKRELLVLGAGKKITEDYYETVFKKDDEKRGELNIPARLLFPQSIADYAKRINAYPLTETKLLPQSVADPTVVDIWQDNVAFMMHDIEPFIVSIKNQKLADSFREYFETLWNQDVLVTTGLTNVQSLFYKKLNGLKKNDEYVILWANYGNTTRDIMIPFFQEYHKKRTEKGVRVKLLGFEKDREALLKEILIGGDPEMQLSEVRFFTEEVGSPLQINIYPDSITLVHWAEGEEAVAIDIHRSDVRNAMMLYFKALWSQDIKIYRGKKQVQMIMERSLEHSENWFIGGNGGIHRVMPEYWVDYNARRIEKGVWWHDLVDINMYMPGIQELPPGEKDKERFYEYKWMPEGVSSPSVILLFGNTVAHIIWEADPEPIAFVIENREIFDAYKKYHAFLWNQSVFTTTTMKDAQKLFHKKLDEMKEGEEIQYMWANYGDETKDELVPFFHELQKKRAHKGVATRVLGFERNREAHDKNNVGQYEQKLIPEDVNSPLEIDIYPESITLVHWGKTDTVAVDIQNKNIRDSMKLYFDSLWNQDAHVIAGRKHVEQLIHRKLNEMNGGEKYAVYGGQYGEKNPEYFFDFWSTYHKKRNAKNISLQIIGFEHIRENLEKEIFTGDERRTKGEVRFLDESLLTPALVMIYPSSAVTIYWDYDEALAIEITRESARKMLLKHFEALWNIAKR